MAGNDQALSRKQKLTIINHFLVALRNTDMAQLEQLMTEDVAWIIPQSSPPPFGGRHEGREKILGMLSVSLFKPNSGGVDIDQVIVEGDRVVAEVTISGETTKGRDYRNYYVFIITLREGRVAEFKEHLDTAYANAVFWAE